MTKNELRQCTLKELKVVYENNELPHGLTQTEWAQIWKNACEVECDASKKKMEKAGLYW
jgi:hypothetical protein